MKRYLIMLGMLSLTLTACAKTANDTVQVGDDTFSSVEPTTPKETNMYFAAGGTELRIDMNRYSENAKLLTADDICLLSFNCGYISENAYERLIIENEEQLDCALEQYGLALPPDGLTMDELWYYNTSIAEPFHKMTAEYPVTDYSYVIEYDEVNSDGYALKVGALLVDADILFFVHDADSHTPDFDLGEGACDVMGGFCYMAAVPKGTLMNEHYEGWMYPETDDTGDIYYKEVSDDDILIDSETGIQYARNQLLISAFPETEKSEIEKIADELNANVVGSIELTGDYQIEFNEDKTLVDLEEIAEYINTYPFIINVTLNLISPVSFNAEEAE